MMGLVEDQLISCKPFMPASFCHVQEASSVVNSCKFQYNLKKSELPSSLMISGEISAFPVPPVFPVSAKAPYILAKACLYPCGVLYTCRAVISFVGTRSSFFVQAARLIMANAQTGVILK